MDYVLAAPTGVLADKPAVLDSERGPQPKPSTCEVLSPHPMTFISGVGTLAASILVALAVPLIVLAVGLPVVLVVRLVYEIVRMLAH